MPRPLDDLGPDFDRRWKQSSRTTRRELIAELRDLYLMLEDRDRAVLARTRPARSDEPAGIPLLVPERAPRGQQGTLFADAGEAPSRARADNPFLPRSVLDRLQESRSRATAGLRDLMQVTTEEIARRPAAIDAIPATPDAAPADMPPPSHEQSDLERELRLKLGPVVESLIETQMETLRSELRVRLRLEMDRLIAEHVRK